MCPLAPPPPPEVIAKHGWPTCAICRKPVDELVELVKAGDFGRTLRLVVLCHGDFEVVEIEREVLLAMSQSERDSIRFGEAFAPKGSAAALRVINDVAEEQIESARKRLLKRTPSFR